jgi:hypothetical protein
MKRNMIFITGMLSILTAFPLLSSCNDNDAPSRDRTHYDEYQVLVRFESASGINLVDSLNLTNRGVLFEIVDPEENDLVQVSCDRQTDGKQMDFHRFGWFHPIQEGLMTELVEAGTVLDFAWGEFYDDDLGRRPDYDEVYTVHIKSPAIFGTDEEHTIKWYSHIIGRCYDCYRCEIDGEEYAFTETDFYSYLHPVKEPGYYTTNWKEVANVIINIKERNTATSRRP